jgi:uncharacterized RDD family membrane protein YckC
MLGLGMETLQPPVARTLKIYAGFWLRAAAALIDVSVLFIPIGWIFTFVLIAIKLIIRFNDDAYTIAILVSFPSVTILATVLYFAVMESSRLQASVGKLVVGLHVSDLEGRRVTRGRAAARTWAKLLSSMTLGIGFVLCAFTRQKQALHDMTAKCLVLRGRCPDG